MPILYRPPLKSLSSSSLLLKESSHCLRCCSLHLLRSVAGFFLRYGSIISWFIKVVGKWIPAALFRRSFSVHLHSLNFLENTPDTLLGNHMLVVLLLDNNAIMKILFMRNYSKTWLILEVKSSVV
ncbi:hypothetical protein M758_UG153600 [Ceratodon purpureus]|nr:hypothetical protein M758_UG153600 [Ceratodon purpureus]